MVLWIGKEVYMLVLNRRGHVQDPKPERTEDKYERNARSRVEKRRKDCQEGMSQGNRKEEGVGGCGKWESGIHIMICTY
jgi:hypothetical protein